MGRRMQLMPVLVVGWAIFSAPCAEASCAVVAAPAKPLSAVFSFPSVSMRPGDSVALRLLVSNPNAVPMRVTSVQVLTTPRLIVRQLITATNLGTIAPQTTVTAPLRVSAAGGFSGGKLGILLTASPPRGPAQITSVSLVVAGDAAGPPLTLTLEIPDALQDGANRSGIVRLASAITGFSTVTLTALDSEDVHIKFTCATGLAHCSAAGSALTFTGIPPGYQLSVPLTVHVDTSVHIGEQTVGVLVRATPNTEQPIPPVLSQALTNVKLSVFVIDILSPFGVTALFVLPGLLAVIVFLGLGRLAYPRTKSIPNVSDFRDPQVMAIIVPVSAIAYVFIWWLFGHDLRQTASTSDVYWLFVIGMLFGVFAWAWLAVFYWVRIDRRSFKRRDAPAKVLRRLQLRSAPLTLPRRGSGQVHYFVLDDKDTDTFTGCSGIRSSFPPGADDDQDSWGEAVAAEDLDALRKLAKQHRVRLRWADSGVRVINKDGLAAVTPARLIEDEIW